MTPMSLNDFPDDIPVAQRRSVRLLSLLIGGPPDPLEIVLGALKTAFGYWLLRYDVFATAPNLYCYVKAIPEPIWGILFLALGALQWTGYYREQNKLRYSIGILAAMAWDWYGYQIWRADHRAPSLVFLSVIAGAQMLACIWLYDKAFPKLRASLDANHDKS